MTSAKRILALGALLCASTAYAGTPGWTVSESSGSVTVSRPGYSAVATRGGAVKAGDVISTGKNGRAVLVRGEEYLVVSPSARITIADPKPGAMTQIIQSFGNTLYKIKKMATPHFAVETPYLAAVVKGTTFSVTVTPKGASVQVTEGRVEVATPDGGASYLVTPGEIGIVSRDTPYRLKIEGKETRTIESPNRPAAPAPADIEVQAIETTSALDASISDGISEGSVQLASLSGGMISGDSVISIATATTRVAPVVPPVAVAELTPPTPLPTVPADTDKGASLAGSAPTVSASVVAAAPGTASPTPLPPASADVVPAVPPVLPSGGSVVPVSGVDAASATTPPMSLPPVPADVVPTVPPAPETVVSLPPVPVDVVPAVPPVTEMVIALPPVSVDAELALPPIIFTAAPIVQGGGNISVGGGASGIGAVVSNLPAGIGNGGGNNGNGQGNGGGNGSNGNGWGLGIGDRDNGRGVGRMRDDD